MIVTLTPNPSIDRTVTVERLHPGEVNRATTTRTDPGGKGVNVARALIRNQGEALAVLPLGGPDGQWMAHALTDGGVPHRAVPIAGNTRTNIAIVDSSGETTKINEPGPQLDAGTVAALLEAIPTQARFVALCGSLPPSTEPSLFGAMTATHRARTVVDTSGPALAMAVAQGPALIKPNAEELAELAGRTLHTLGDVEAAARAIVDQGVGVVVASLGADGALWVSATDLVFAQASVERPLSTVGAGDCLLAGVLGALDRGADPVEALRQGVAWGAAAVSLPGSAVPGPSDIDAVRVHSTTTPDLATPIS